MLLHPDGRRAELAAALSKRLGHPVQIGKLDAALFPPTLGLHDVTVFQRPDAPLLHVEKIQATLDWGGLFRTKIVPAGLTFDRWTLSSRRHSNGVWDWDEWLGGNAKGTLLDGWPLQRITLRQGEWHWIDETASQELVLKDVQASWDRTRQAVAVSGALTAATPITFLFEGKGSFFAAPKWSGDLRLADEGRSLALRLDGQPGRMDAEGQASEWRLDNAHHLAAFYLRWPARPAEPAGAGLLRDWKTQFAWTTGHMTFSQSAALDGGFMEVKGDVQAGPAEPILALKGAVQDMPLEALAFVTGGLKLDGKLTGIVTDFAISLSSRAWESVNGRGFVQVKAGNLRVPASTMKGLAKARTLAYMRRKYKNFETQGLPFVRCEARWQAKDGFFITDDGWCVGTDLKAAWVGKLDALRRGIDVYARFQLEEKSPHLLKLISGRYVLGAPGHERVQPIYGRVQGSWSDWTLRAAKAGKIPSSVKSRLDRARP